MNDVRSRPMKRHWWSKEEQTAQEELRDDELNSLLEEVENEFKSAYEYHAKRLRELKEALRARQEANRR